MENIMQDAKRRWILLMITVMLAAMGMGCPPQRTDSAPLPEFAMGKADAAAYLQHTVRLYRLVIKLQAMKQSAQEAYVRGFQETFLAAGKKNRGGQIGEVLLKAARGHDFAAAKGLGQRHVRGEVTNARIQSLIHGSLNRGPSVELSWKAGYIEGFRQALGKERLGADEEKLYDEAQAVYDALRSSL